MSSTIKGLERNRELAILFTDEKLSYEEIIEFIYSFEDWFDRGEIIDSLGNYVEDNEIIEKVMMTMLDDSHYMVRSDACEALYGSKSPEVFKKLLDRLKKERSSLVRMWIIGALSSNRSLSTINAEETKLLHSLFNREKHKRVIISYHALFYVLSHDIAQVQYALQYLNDEDYHIREIVIHSLSDVLDAKAAKLAVDAYIARREKEETVAVRSSLDQEIEHIQSKME